MLFVFSSFKVIAISSFPVTLKSLAVQSLQNISIHCIHSFRLFLERLSESTTTQRRSRHSTDTVLKFHAEAPRSAASEGLAQGSYAAARAGFEPTTLWTKGDKFTNKKPRPTMYCMVLYLYIYLAPLRCITPIRGTSNGSTVAPPFELYDTMGSFTYYVCKKSNFSSPLLHCVHFVDSPLVRAYKVALPPPPYTIVMPYQISYRVSEF